MTAEAVIDLRTDGTMIVQSYSRTDDFLWIATGAPVRLPFAMPDAGLSVAVAAALSESLVGIPRPERLDGLMAPALKAAGVRSQRTYYEGTRSVVVQESDDGSIQVGPTWRRARVPSP